jgi:PHD/YefM family antitoxin component YafN of YafNO toxin-antitoxin module
VTFPSISPHIIKNRQGEKLGVFIDMDDYQRLMDHIEDLCLGRIAQAIKRRDKEAVSVSLDELKAKRKTKKS